MQKIDSVDALFDLLRHGGGEAYFGEPVTVLEHSLQAAWFAERKGGNEALVAAALLHDVGHLLHGEGEDAAARGSIPSMKSWASKLCGNTFRQSVLDPIRLHVAAKRYLCFAEPRYFAALSPASVAESCFAGRDDDGRGGGGLPGATACAGGSWCCGALTMRPKCKDWRCRSWTATERVSSSLWR